MSTVLLYVGKGEERLYRELCRRGQERNACSVCLLEAADPLLVKGTTLIRNSLAEDILSLS